MLTKASIHKPMEEMQLYDDSSDDTEELFVSGMSDIFCGSFYLFGVISLIL